MDDCPRVNNVPVAAAAPAAAPDRMNVPVTLARLPASFVRLACLVNARAGLAARRNALEVLATAVPASSTPLAADLNFARAPNPTAPATTCPASRAVCPALAP